MSPCFSKQCRLPSPLFASPAEEDACAVWKSFCFSDLTVQVSSGQDLQTNTVEGLRRT